MSKKVKNNSVWESLCNSTSEATVMTLKSALMRKCRELFEESCLNMYEFADHCNIGNKKAAHIIDGKIDKVSIKTLIAILVETETPFKFKYGDLSIKISKKK